MITLLIILGIWLYFIEAKYDVTIDKNIGFK